MFDSLTLLPSDPILGLIARFRNDANPNKIDLGVGVYKDAEGATPVLASVKQAEQLILNEEQTKSYIGPNGNVSFNAHMAELIFGKGHSALTEERVTTLQTPGGCGALRVAAEFIVKTKKDARIWVSDPTWGNHTPLLGDSGLQIETYPYYDFEKHAVNFDGMMDTLAKVPEGDLVLLHACCHNPSGGDLNKEQWHAVTKLIQERGLIPFVDMAYQGFGDSLEEDNYGLRYLADNVPQMVFAVSCSKNFGLYRERVGAVGVLSSSASQASVIGSHLMRIVRGIYSMPPSHGAAVVEKILSDASLRESWVGELNEMRDRIQSMRNELVSQCRTHGLDDRFSFISNEKGMFSFLGISEDQVERLASEYSIYMVNTSRISVAGLNPSNMEYFCSSLAKVLA